MTILANLQNFSLSFGQKILFQEGNLTISNSDRIGLIGLNGHGKSTLLKIINGLMVPDETNPPFIYDKNKDLNILYIPQEIDTSNFPELNIKNYYLAFYPELFEIYKSLWKIEKELENNQNIDQNISLQVLSG